MFHQIFFNQWNRSLDRCLSNDQWATPHLYLDDEQSDIVWLSEGISPGVGLLHLIDRTRAWHQATQTGQTIIKTGRAGRATIFNVVTRDNATMRQCIKASVIHTKIIFFLAYWVTMEFWHNIYRQCDRPQFVGLKTMFDCRNICRVCPALKTRKHAWTTSSLHVLYSKIPKQVEP